MVVLLLLVLNELVVMQVVLVVTAADKLQLLKEISVSVALPTTIDKSSRATSVGETVEDGQESARGALIAHGARVVLWRMTVRDQPSRRPSIALHARLRPTTTTTRYRPRSHRAVTTQRLCVCCERQSFATMKLTLRAANLTVWGPRSQVRQINRRLLGSSQALHPGRTVQYQ